MSESSLETFAFLLFFGPYPGTVAEYTRVLAGTEAEEQSSG